MKMKKNKRKLNFEMETNLHQNVKRQDDYKKVTNKMNGKIKENFKIDITLQKRKEAKKKK